MKNSKLISNTLANYLSKLWAITSIYVFVPFYIKILGIENYGIITFQTIIFSFVYIADAGLSAAFSRECARTESRLHLRPLLLTLEKTISMVLLLVLSIVYFSAEWLANYWLNSNGEMNPEVIEYCIKLMAIGMGPQILMALYFGGLMGLERQSEANLIHVIYGFFRSAIVLLPLVLIPKIEVYFYWYILVSIVFCLVFRIRLLSYIGCSSSNRNKESHISALKKVAGFSTGMLALSIMSALINQMDKIFVSGRFDLSDLSSYNLASILSQSPYFLTLPIAVAVLPRITNLLSLGEYEDKDTLYLRASIIISVVSSLVCFNVYFYLKDISSIWLGAVTASTVQELAPYLLFGNLFLSLQLMPFQLAIANGHNMTSVKLGIINIFLYLPLLYYFSEMFGLLGATIPWLIINALNFILLSIFINKRYCSGNYLTWLFICCLKPVLIIFSIVYIGVFINVSFGFEIGSILSIPYASLFSLIALLVVYVFNFKDLKR
ncbi:hypothetical protein DZ860_08180 [Vibrio sinensis]|uniref:Polysaccharide biosynthesis protein n=1 Tax=Vibrio sinensis TaxID=2302434 RepID=A0A3A6QVD8_9VIBR|nr:hypothetical protein [Vibrio sinensis]RJX72379.1 hypothetical protein DZ860_08180 [Vibrio sinensis]